MWEETEDPDTIHSETGHTLPLAIGQTFVQPTAISPDPPYTWMGIGYLAWDQKDLTCWNSTVQSFSPQHLLMVESWEAPIHCYMSTINMLHCYTVDHQYSNENCQCEFGMLIFKIYKFSPKLLQFKQFSQALMVLALRAFSLKTHSLFGQ